MLKTARLVDREVAVMHLIDDQILSGNKRAAVGTPSLGIGFGHVQHRTTLAINANGCGPYARTFTHELAVILHVKGVEHPLQVALDSSLPKRSTILSTFQVDGFYRFSSQARLVDAQFHLLGIGVGLNREFTRPGAISNPGASVNGLRYE